MEGETPTDNFQDHLYGVDGSENVSAGKGESYEFCQNNPREGGQQERDQTEGRDQKKKEKRK